MADESERPYKKRKGPDSSAIRVGSKTISLDGYLNSKPSTKVKPDASSTQATVDARPDAEDSSSKQDERNQNHIEIHASSHKGKPRDSRASSTIRGASGWKDNPALLKTRKALPIWEYKDKIQQSLRKSDVLILIGETGSGKSTQIPQFLYQESWCQKQVVKVKNAKTSAMEDIRVGGTIAVTQPRRVAATTLAYRVSQEAGTPLGKMRDGLVGYSVRFDHMVPRGTRIKFLTEGMLLQELLADPWLRQYSAVVVDEIHERSVDVDLVAGFLKQLLLGDKAGRGGVPLKVVVMSATAKVEVINDFFRAPPDEEEKAPAISVQNLQIEGRQYPVETIHTPKPVADLQDSLLKAIFKIHLHEPLPGDILAFLSGQEEIEAAQKLIEEYAATLASDVPKIVALPLFGQLSIEAQHQAFQWIKGGYTRKVVLATNIAETSVTVPGVRFVIDCGKAKVKQYRSRLGMESLLAKPISKSSAIQRTGRAGREGPGKCFRLYTEETFKSLREIDLPEILRNDVLGAVLTMKARGVDDILSFPLMDLPDIESIEKALIHLHLLGALDGSGTITDIGRTTARFPVTAPYGRVILAAAEPDYDCLLEAIDIISCITAGEDIFHQLQPEEVREEVEEFRKQLYRREGDLITYLTTMQQYASENSDRIEWCKARKINLRNMRQALKIRKQLRGLCLKEKLLDEAPPPDPQPFAPVSPDRAETIIKCFLKGFVLKTAMLAPDSSYVTTQGKHIVAIHPASVLHGHKREAIMFLEHVFTQKNYAKKVTAIQANWVAEELEGH
jgi:ATP-dependent RNA helicase DHR2